MERAVVLGKKLLLQNRVGSVIPLLLHVAFLSSVSKLFSLSLVCQLAKASPRDRSHAIYVCTMFFLSILQEPPLPELSMSRRIKASPSGVSLNPLGSTCCSQINRKKKSIAPAADLSKHATACAGLLCTEKWYCKKSGQLLCP